MKQEKLYLKDWIQKKVKNYMIKELELKGQYLMVLGTLDYADPDILVLGRPTYKKLLAHQP